MGDFPLHGICEWCSEEDIPLLRHRKMRVCGMCKTELEDYDKAPLTEKAHREAQRLFNKF